MSTGIQTRMILIIGTNGTGKTTLARTIFDSVSCKRKLVVTQHATEWAYLQENKLSKADDLLFTGQNWHLVIDEKKIFKKLNSFSNGVLLFDDCMNYMTSQTDIDIKRLYISRRQKAVHIIMIAHGLTEVPPKAFTFCTDIFLFATRDNIDSTRKNTVQDYEKLLAVQQRVNQTAKEKDWHYYEHIQY
jgi:ABC-type Mn2+/Zn2+ transport system ATPase subunit